jgi:hypothetical protein
MRKLRSFASPNSLVFAQRALPRSQIDALATAVDSFTGSEARAGVSAANRYAMLISSLPYHGVLFGARQTPLSRIRLQQRLSLLEPADAACLQAIAELLGWSHLGLERRDEEIIDYARAVIPTLDSSFVRDLVVWRLEVRTVVAALRHRQRGQAAPPAHDRWGYGRWLAHLRKHWNEPHFRLEGAYPWLPEARTLLESGDALGLERLLMGIDWEHLERLADGHHFDFEAVLLYTQRWDLIARWTGYNGETAMVRFDEMVESGLRAAPLDALVA